MARPGLLQRRPAHDLHRLRGCLYRYLQQAACTVSGRFCCDIHVSVPTSQVDHHHCKEAASHAAADPTPGVAMKHPNDSCNRRIPLLQHSPASSVDRV